MKSAVEDDEMIMDEIPKNPNGPPTAAPLSELTGYCRSLAVATCTVQYSKYIIFLQVTCWSSYIQDRPVLTLLR